ncbi:50S ribosomal protein L24 [Candidatus Gottesmanbacteria bacterium]|nr:50S ribosomal protein L24 [Candidatus Gottesmanbacteria bacterium]
MKLKKGDTVIVTIGRDRGKRGKVEKVFPKARALLVSGVNTFKRHMKKRDEKNPGGIIDIHRPLSASKVSIICPSCGKPTRVGYLVSKGEKTRICRKCGKKL